MSSLHLGAAPPTGTRHMEHSSTPTTPSPLAALASSLIASSSPIAPRIAALALQEHFDGQSEPESGTDPESGEEGEAEVQRWVSPEAEEVFAQLHQLKFVMGVIRPLHERHVSKLVETREKLQNLRSRYRLAQELRQSLDRWIFAEGRSVEAGASSPGAAEAGASSPGAAEDGTPPVIQSTTKAMQDLGEQCDVLLQEINATSRNMALLRRETLLMQRALKECSYGDSEVPKCPICMCNSASTAFMPCGHVVCSACVSFMCCQEGEQVKRCFMCRSTVTGFMRLFF